MPGERWVPELEYATAYLDGKHVVLKRGHTYTSRTQAPWVRYCTASDATAADEIVAALMAAEEHGRRRVADRQRAEVPDGG